MTKGLLSLLVCGLFAASCARQPLILTVRLDRSELQEKLAERFPIEREKYLSRVILENPSLILENGRDVIGVALDVVVDLPFLDPQTGRVGLAGVLSYKRELKAIYLEQPRIEALELGSLSPEHVELAKPMIEAAAAAVLERYPIYVLQGKNLKELTAEHVLQQIAVEQGQLVLTFGLGSS